MIDTSHGNSGKDLPPPARGRRTPSPSRWRRGEPGIIGVMLESFLVDGRQDLTDRADLTAGQSITDACMGWEMTAPVLHDLADAVRVRRTTGHESTLDTGRYS